MSAQRETSRRYSRSLSSGSEKHDVGAIACWRFANCWTVLLLSLLLLLLLMLLLLLLLFVCFCFCFSSFVFLFFCFYISVFRSGDNVRIYWSRCHTNWLPTSGYIAVLYHVLVLITRAFCSMFPACPQCLWFPAAYPLPVLLPTVSCSKILTCFGY